MSAPAARDQVADELEQMCVPGELLHPEAVMSTWHRYGDSLKRLEVWESVIEQFLGRQSGVSHSGRAVVITAGPPGAGKSTALSHHLVEHNPENEGLAGCRRIDADVLKDHLLQVGLEDGTLRPLLALRLAGRYVTPRELSGVVHEESVRLAREIRRRCMRSSEDIVIEGTLWWPAMVSLHLGEVLQYGYDVCDVVSVKVPREVARERLLDLWWSKHLSGDPLGGRFVPRAAVDACYEKGSRVSLCRDNALELHRRAAEDHGLVSTLSLVQHRDVAQGGTRNAEDDLPRNSAQVLSAGEGSAAS